MLNGVGMNYNNTIYGDGIFETSNGGARHNGSEWSGKGGGSWYDNQSYHPDIFEPFFTLGGFWGRGSEAGVFAFDITSGHACPRCSFRPIVFAKK